MSKSRVGGLMVAVAGSWALGACMPAVTGTSAQSAQSASAAGANPITSGPQIGRCYSDGCTWFDIQSFEMIRETEDGALIRLTMREGGSRSGSGPHPENARGVDIEWEGYTSSEYVFCSKKLPAMISSEDGGAAEATVLDLLQWGVPTEVITNIYAHVCHNGERILDEGMAQRAGYRSMEGQDREISLPSPVAIFDHLRR